MKCLSTAMAVALSMVSVASVSADVTVNKAKTADKAFKAMDAYVRGIAVPDPTGRYGPAGGSYTIEDFQVEALDDGVGHFDGGDPTTMQLHWGLRATFHALSLSTGQSVPDSFDLGLSLSGVFDDPIIHGTFGGVSPVFANPDTVGGVPLFDVFDAPAGSLQIDLSSSWKEAPPFVFATFHDLVGTGAPQSRFMISGALGGGTIEAGFVDSMQWTSVPAPGPVLLGGIGAMLSTRRRRGCR